MRVIAFLMFMLGSLTCWAFDTIMVVGGKSTDKIVIDVTPCQSKTLLDAIKPEYQAQFKRAIYFYRLEAQKQGYPQKIEGCWIAIPQRPDVLMTVWEDGDRIPVPVNVLKAGTEADRFPIKPFAI
jgi:hypothetical protein